MRTQACLLLHLWASLWWCLQVALSEPQTLRVGVGQRRCCVVAGGKAQVRVSCVAAVRVLVCVGARVGLWLWLLAAAGAAEVGGWVGEFGGAVRHGVGAAGCARVWLLAEMGGVRS